MCNGNNTVQETLLPSNTTKTQHFEGREMIIMESMTNLSKEPDQDSLKELDTTL